MAGSRLDKIGTIFSRTAGLLKSGAIKYQDRPIWYDIYRVFPPKYEPYVDREPTISVDQVPNILYKEDKVRARFFKTFGLNPDGKGRKLGDPTFEDTSSKFVSKFNELQTANPDWSFDQVFETVGEEFHELRREKKKRFTEGNEEKSFKSGSGGVSATAVVEGEEDNRDGSEMVGVSRSKRISMISAESLRALFEEAKSNQNQGKGGVGQSGGGDGDGRKSGDK